jgi:transcriptional regulator with XRE-family HTH domain
MSSVGETIRTAREAKGWTQYQLAEALDMSRGAVAKWESNLTYPHDSTIEKLCEVLQLEKRELNRYGSGGISVVGVVATAQIEQYSWKDIALVVAGHEPMDARTVIVEETTVNPINEKEIRLIVKDDSMAPTFNKGDAVRIAREIQPYDGCQVAALVDGEEEGVLRNYRLRNGGAYDLWPDNPEYQTVTANEKTKVTIFGVVTAHWRHIRPPQ